MDGMSPRNGLYAHPCQDSRTSGNRPGVVTPAAPPPLPASVPSWDANGWTIEVRSSRSPFPLDGHDVRIPSAKEDRAYILWSTGTRGGAAVRRRDELQ